MKVLKAGREQRGWSCEATCTGAGNGNGGCGAGLLVEQGDLYRTHSTDYGGGHDIYITFKCVSCGVETDLQGVPAGIRGAIPDKAQHGSQLRGGCSDKI